VVHEEIKMNREEAKRIQGLINEALAEAAEDRKACE
jgi:hypothetical protein